MIRPAPIALALLLISSLAAEAGLFADMQTSRGPITIDLQYAKTPKTTANFISLAEGTRSWLHPSTGVVKAAPLYNGLVFHRVVNTGTFKIAQAGSLKNDGSDQPGFVFKDEFDATLRNTPYVLSMANAGPNTNGSDFFFTGNVAIPSLDDVHTVFGLVTDTPSRAVIDSILTAGAGQTTIQSVTIRRTDPAALAFDASAQSLPSVVGLRSSLKVIKGTSANATLTGYPVMPSGSVFHAFRSTDLQS